MLGEEAVPHTVRYLECETEKEKDMIKYFEFYKTWRAQSWKSSQVEGEFRGIYIQSWDPQAAKEKLHRQEMWETSKREEASLETRWTNFATGIN